jgi:long-chain acyl-CoA synthetase
MSEDPILSAFDRLVVDSRTRILIASDERCATVGEVALLAELVSRFVTTVGIPQNGIVALAAANGPGFFAGYLGLRRAGYKVLLVDWPIPGEAMEKTLRAIGAIGALIVNRSWPGGSADFEFRSGLESGYSADLPPDVSTIRLTSGSTGTPRGIIHTSEALLNDDRSLRATMGLEDERVLAAIPLSHAYGFASVFLPAITCGWTLIVPSSVGPFGASAAALAGEVTFLPTVPAYISSLLKLSRPPALPDSVRLIISAGARLKPETAVRFREHYDRDIHVFYGASEVGGIAYDRDGSAAARGAMGTPVEGVRIELEPTDRDDQVVGTVVVRSASAAVGYFPKPDQSLQGGRFVTSDVGRFDCGELVLVGRVDSVINVRGKKVWPREVESILEAVPGVDDAIVIRASARDGSGDEVQALVASSGEAPSETTLLGACRSQLEPYKVPRRLRVVESIPRTSRGKADFVAIRAALSKETT